MKVREEMSNLVRALEKAGVPYALCGGLAMAVHGWPRATLDIDLLVQEDRLEEVRKVARSQGFREEAGFMNFSAGRVRLYRMVRLESDEFLVLDLLLAVGDFADVWTGRMTVRTEDGDISVVSADGLIRMKELRGSGTDQDDIRKLKGDIGEGH